MWDCTLFWWSWYLLNEKQNGVPILSVKTDPTTFQLKWQFDNFLTSSEFGEETSLITGAETEKKISQRKLKFFQHILWNVCSRLTWTAGLASLCHHDFTVNSQPSFAILFCYWFNLHLNIVCGSVLVWTRLYEDPSVELHLLEWCLTVTTVQLFIL